ncbi:neuroglobin-like [Pecten maximus]|uniref:neuroglobin-like n=1 Tax=Pecten maximus TaxID=6579 RepID=UPI001458F8DB|nr:neuroglobin-like [Pecten maximus]
MTSQFRHFGFKWYVSGNKPRKPVRICWYALFHYEYSIFVPVQLVRTRFIKERKVESGIMGCAHSMKVASKPSVSTAKKNFVTDKQKRIIKKTWKMMCSNITGHGVKVFLRIFQLHPHVKQLFPCRDVEGEDLLRDSNFKGHASRFMQAVGAAVDNIDDIEAVLTPLLFGLGRNHIKFTGFKNEYFDVFTEAMMYTWHEELQEKFNDETSQAWATIFEFIMGNLKAGHSEALANSQRIEKSNIEETEFIGVNS